jgi:lipoprotein signal peptidase
LSSAPHLGDHPPTSSAEGPPLDALPPERSAAASARCWAGFVTFAAAGLWLDLWSKDWAFNFLRQGETHVIVPHVLEFQTLLNAGALFGIGAGQTTVFLVASVAALGLVGWMLTQTPARRWVLQMALAAILAGALGNMYDRAFVRLADVRIPSQRGVGVYAALVERSDAGYVLREYPTHRGGAQRTVREMPNEVGFVRDFIKIPTRWFGGAEVWPWVFNVADILLVCGVSVLALHVIGDRKRQPEPDAVESSVPASASDS